MSSESEGKLYLEFFKLRTCKPAKSIAYWLYFSFVIVLIGILSALITNYLEYYNVNFRPDRTESVAYNILSFSIVLMCTSSIDLIFVNPQDNIDEEKFIKINNALIMTGVGILFLSILFALLIFIVNFLSWIKLAIAILICIIALYTWWVTNARSLSVLQKPEPPNADDITGGDPLQQLPGNTTGYTS